MKIFLRKIATALLFILILSPSVFAETTSEEILRQKNLLEKHYNRLRFHTKYYKLLENEMEETKDNLLLARDKIATLEDQVDLISRQVRMQEQKVLSLKKKIREREDQIHDIYGEIEQKEVEIEDGKKLLGNSVKMIYMHQKRFYESEELNMVKLLLADNSVSQTLQNKTYLAALEETTEALVQKLETSMTKLDTKKRDVTQELGKMEAYKQYLEEAEDELKAQKEGKKKLLEETQGKEEIYQKMLAETLEQQQEVLDEIQALRTNIEHFDSRLKNLKSTITPEEYQEILKIKEETVRKETQSQGDILEFDIWPVNPSLGISAYFSDAGYKKIFGTDHGAVDMPTYQETPILAVADGLVVKVRDKDTGYNYLAVAHRKGVMTVYGHITKSLVEVGDYVHEGEGIALSGGIPGTRGSGLRTTGAHLHFEVFQDGARVDPLEYLPLDILSESAIPAKYKKQELDDLL